jgi:predicted amidohydrolase YtcJ
MCHCNPKSVEGSPFHWAFTETNREKLRSKLSSVLTKRIQKIAEYINCKLVGPTATHIFKNGVIYTMNEKVPIVEAVAIHNNKILKMGKNDEMEEIRKKETKVVDLKGKVMLPGFIEPHIHMCFCLIDHWLDLGPYLNKGLNEVKLKLVEAVKTANPNYLLAAKLFTPQLMEGDFDYSLKGLDEISQEVGIFILQSNGHVAHVNSMAFKMVGIDKNTPNPPHGRFMKDDKGELTGEVQEMAVNCFKSNFAEISAEQYEVNFKNFL